MYTEDNVFPLEEVYTFARAMAQKYPRFAHRILAIKKRDIYPQRLWRAGGYSEVRRVLAYRALMRSCLWPRFIRLHWSTGDNKYGHEIIQDLKLYFLTSGRLAKCKGRLLPELQVLVP